MGYSNRQKGSKKKSLRGPDNSKVLGGDPSAFSDSPVPLPARRKKKERRFSDSGVTDEKLWIEDPKAAAKKMDEFKVRGIATATKELEEAMQIKDPSERNLKEKEALNVLRYKNPDKDQDCITWDDNSFYNMRSKEGIYRSINPYKIYLDWEAKMQAIEENDTREPHARFLQLLSEWENARKIARMKKAGFRFPAGTDPLKYFDPPVVEQVPPEVEFNSPPLKTYLDPEKYLLEEVAPLTEQPKAPLLHHNLDRTLFSPGVHVLRDERTNVYNFPPYLENVMSIRDFDFGNVPAFVPSSQDKNLSKLAAQEKKQFTASTSSLTAVLSQLHFLISRNRPPSAAKLSHHFKDKSVEFGFSAKKAVSMFLRWHPDTKTYSLDADKTQDEEIILSLLGQVLEAKLTIPNEEFESFAKSAEELEPELDKERPSSTYHYSTCGNFLMRSQIDCYDPRLPGTGVFDVKTRAVCAVRHDIDYAQIREGSDYQLNQIQGHFESYEREMFDLIRTTLFKYSLQARIGRMDGIFVAYHNIRKMFGFEYLPLAEIDKVFHSGGYPLEDGQVPEVAEAQAPLIADQEFRLSVQILSQILEATIKKFPEQSVNIVFKSPTTASEIEFQDSEMVVLMNPMPEANIDKLQRGIPLEEIPAQEAEELDQKIATLSGPELKEARKIKARQYLDRNTLFQSYDQAYSGPFSQCIGWRVNVTNFINGEPLPANVHPTVLPGQKWTVGVNIKDVQNPKFKDNLELACFGLFKELSKPTSRNRQHASYPSYLEPSVPSQSVVAAVDTLQTIAAPPHRKNGRLVSQPDTVRRSQEEIADLVDRQLAMLGQPTELQRVLRTFDEKGRQAVREHEREHGHREKVVWSSGSAVKVANGSK